MTKGESKRDPFEVRRRKEQVAFLVVKFLRASMLFREIEREFDSHPDPALRKDGGLFEKVRELVNGLLFDLKEKAHALFRGTRKPGTRHTSEARSLDSLIGTGYHLMLILQEALYQVERYAPELEKEKDELSARVAAESAELAVAVMKRCRTVFRGTLDVVHRFLAKSHDNEILLLNLVRNVDLLEHVYGREAAEEILASLCRGHDSSGASVYERALSCARERCGNTTGLPAVPVNPPASAS
jgi:hypothetical protein